MMSTKLTLTIQEEIIMKAKKYAKSKDRSLSNIIENYLKLITSDCRISTEPNYGAVVTSLKGSFKSDIKLDYKKARNHRLEEKYLR